MSVQNPVLTPATRTTSDAHVATWANVKAGDTFNPIGVPEQSDRSIQIDGTFSGATAGLEGSIDGAVYFTLHDPQGVVISGTAPKLAAVLELVSYVRGFVTGGDVNTNLNFRLLHKKAR